MDPSAAGISSQIGYLVGVFLTILGGAYFSVAENACSASSYIRLRTLADDGNKKAKLALHLRDHFEQVLSTILIGLNILLLLGASFATQFVWNLFGRTSESEAISATIATVASAILVFFFADLVPKSFAITHPDSFAMALAPSLYVLTIIFYPVTILVKWFSDFLKKIFHVKEEPVVTEEEISDIIDTAEEEGVVDEEQSDLLQSALEFSDTTISDVLTLKKDIVAIEVNTPKEEVKDFIEKENFSRFPVYEKDLEHIIGILQVKSFLRNYIQNKPYDLKASCTKAFETTLDQSIDDVLEQMSSKKTTMAIVRTEVGGEVIGLVTMEDLLEELVGEIYDEDEIVNHKFENLGGNYFKVHAKCTMGECFTSMDYHGKVNVSRVKTIDNFVYEQLGHTPQEDEEFEWRDLTFTVTDVENGKLQYVEIKLADPILDAVNKDDEEDEL